MVKLSELELPIVIKDKLLFAPGNWNNWEIKGKEIQKAFENTDWTSKKNKALYYEHKDNDSEKWTGNIINQKLKGDRLYGDVEVWDINTAIKLGEGEAPFAISAMISWPAIYEDPTDFKFNNFSLVSNPGVQLEEMYINFAKDEDGEKKVKFTIKEDLKSIERRSNLNNKMEQELNKSSANFSVESFDKLVSRVDALEKSIAKFSEEETTEAVTEEVTEEKSEETSEDVKEVVEETKEEEKEADKAEFSEESKEEVKEVEEESKAAEEKSEEVEEAKFAKILKEELKILKEGFSKPVTPITGALTKKANFSEAVNRLEKEFI